MRREGEERESKAVRRPHTSHVAHRGGVGEAIRAHDLAAGGQNNNRVKVVDAVRAAIELKDGGRWGDGERGVVFTSTPRPRLPVPTG